MFGFFEKKEAHVDEVKAPAFVEWKGWRKFKVMNRKQECVDTTTFTLMPADEQPLPAFRAGQGVALRLEGFEPRAYTLCSTPDEGCYRITIKVLDNDRGALSAQLAQCLHVGDEIEEILNAIIDETAYCGKERQLMKIGVHALPRFPKDATDRNRTSPFAFTGNKFEFRMPGSSASISGINVVLNTAVAESLEQFADALEGSKDFEADLQALIRSVLIKHKRILFKGNGYDAAWIAEAERRGLLNLRTTPEALPYYLADKNVALFTKHHVYTRTEMEARYEIHLENYSKILNIEALTMLEMARRDIMPAVSSYLRELSETAAAIHAASVTADCSYEESIIPEMSALLGDAYRKVRSLDEALMGAKTVEGSQALANYYRDKVFSAMAELRITIDQLETMTPSDKWPVPSYGDLLFSVR